MLTPALRSSVSFSGVLTFGPDVPHYAGDECGQFGSATMSNGGISIAGRTSPMVAMIAVYMQKGWHHQYHRAREQRERRKKWWGYNRGSPLDQVELAHLPVVLSFLRRVRSL